MHTSFWPVHGPRPCSVPPDVKRCLALGAVDPTGEGGDGWFWVHLGFGPQVMFSMPSPDALTRKFVVPCYPSAHRRGSQWEGPQAIKEIICLGLRNLSPESHECLIDAPAFFDRHVEDRIYRGKRSVQGYPPQVCLAMPPPWAISIPIRSLRHSLTHNTQHDLPKSMNLFGNALGTARLFSRAWAWGEPPR